MAQRIGVVVTAMVVVAAGALAPCASAHPAPQPDSSCSADLDGALTQLPDGGAFLTCNGSRWLSFTGPYPSSDRWLSYGPGLQLHGQGRRNPEILSGNWIARPQDSVSTCSAQQSAVVSAGEVGPAQTSSGEPGQPLEFVVLPVVFSITLTGNCLWERRA